jgi:hypothetical protein
VPWLRIFVEGVVIVTSILLAFGIDAWWDGKQDRQGEREVLTLVLANLEADTTAIPRVFRAAPRHFAASTWLTDHWEAADVPTDSVNGVLVALIPISTAQLQSAAYTSVKDGDRLGLILNESLRSAIIGYFDEGQSSAAVRADRALNLRVVALEALWPHVQWKRELDGPETVTLVSPWSEVTIHNPILNKLTMFAAGSYQAMIWGERLLARNQNLRTMIEAELETRW